MSHITDTFPVALTPCASYHGPMVEAAVRLVLAHTVCSPEAPAPGFSRGSTVLVKPNLLRAHDLSCTHAQVVRALCLVLQEQGLRINVADSPGFGTAASVAGHTGLSAALRPLGLAVESLDKARPVPLSRGGSWGVSRHALECDAIISVPKVKAHCQLRASLAVKNLFGCVCGLRKAVAHTAQGKRLEDFTSALLDLWQALPPVAALADGVTAMHVTGPSGGKPFALGLLGASTSAMALDTALYPLLGAQPGSMPLWAAAQARNLPDSRPEQLTWAFGQPGDFTAQGFILPESLIDISFQPHRLVVSLCRRLWSRWKA